MFVAAAGAYGMMMYDFKILFERKKPLRRFCVFSLFQKQTLMTSCCGRIKSTQKAKAQKIITDERKKQEANYTLRHCRRVKPAFSRSSSLFVMSCRLRSSLSILSDEF
jgi:hypothetical protein